MKTIDHATRPARVTLRVLSALLTYPGEDVRHALADAAERLKAEGVLSDASRVQICELIARLRDANPFQVESDYVEIFDRGRATSLHLFEHVHGDSRERGPAMIDLARTYELAGLYLAAGELPDYLPAVLEYASTQPPPQARAFLGEIAHLLGSIGAALRQRASPYASVLAVLLELAGVEEQPVSVARNENIDEAWAEPPVFQGCSTQGQDRAGTPQAIRFHPSRSASRQRYAPGSTGVIP